MTTSSPANVLDYATPPAQAETFPTRWFGWAPFLGISWTWCIGMFLPVLLLRDYGFAGAWIFAIPNVIGAAAMGWVIGSPESSRCIVANHHGATVAFSIVTIAFHFYFAAWLVRLLWSPAAIPILFGASIALMILVQLVRWSDRVLCLLAFLVSLVVLSTIRTYLSNPFSIVQDDAITRIGLSLACLFGFALCPYLDLTFHRARQQMNSKARSRWAFGLGFGLFFVAMISLTADYAKPLWHLLKDGCLLGNGVVVMGVSIHILMQSSLTVAFHVREVLDASFAKPSTGITRRTEVSRWMALPALLILVAIAVVIGAAIPARQSFHGLALGEIVYRGFIGFYGLFFPAYVWLCMMPSRGKRAPLRREGIVFAVAISVALPMFWIGFIERRMVWLIPGVLFVVGARLLLRPEDMVAEATTPAGIQQNSAPISK